MTDAAPAWIPIESNPDVMNKYLGRIGVPENWKIVDVFGLDEDLLAILPRPVLAFILIFPCNEQFEKIRTEEDKAVREKGQSISDNIFYLKQYIGNACGAIALIHSLANSDASEQLGEGCLKSYLADAMKLDPEARGKLLMNNADFAGVHNDVAAEGQTEAPTPETQVDHHFVAFVHRDGALYELDGRKSFPINHGATTQETFVEDAAKVLKDWMKKDTSEIRFGICALAANLD